MIAIYPHNPLSPPWDINAPWWYILQAEAWAEELDRAAWVEELRQRWGLVTRENDLIQHFRKRGTTLGQD